MNTILVICAESAIVDQQSNKLTVFGVAEELSAAGFPAMLSSLTLVVMAERKPSEGDNFSFSIRISTNGKHIFETPYKLSFQGKTRARAIITLQQVVVTQPGTVTFAILKKQKVLGSWTIRVVDVSQPALAPPTQKIDSESGVVTKKVRLKKKREKSKKRA